MNGCRSVSIYSSVDGFPSEPSASTFLAGLTSMMEGSGEAEVTDSSAASGVKESVSGPDSGCTEESRHESPSSKVEATAAVSNCEPDSIKDGEKETDSSKENKSAEEGASAAVPNASQDRQKEFMEKDPELYAYTNKVQFTSELFKLEIRNLPTHLGFGQFKKRLLNLGVNPVKMKMTYNSGQFGYITFRNEEEREKALEILNGHVWKGKVWSVKKALPAPDPLQRKRKLDAEKDASGNAKVAKDEIEDEDIPVAERLHKVVTPLYNIPYEEQLKMKTAEIENFLKRLSREISYNNADMKPHIKLQKDSHRGLPCALFPIKHSPEINYYRNKCEFTVGQNTEGVDKTVGFRLATYKKGNVKVVEADECLHIPASMKRVTKALQTYLQTRSSLPAYDPEKRSGYWRTLTLRTTQTGQMMVIVIMHRQDIDFDEAAVEKEKEKLKKFMEDGGAEDNGITSVYFQLEYGDRGTAPLVEEHIYGATHIIEKLLNLDFRISPSAFFQVNTKAAEVLYKTVAEWSCLTPKTTLLDICCGTGTIGLTMAKHVKQVIGIDMVEKAVADARINSELNGLLNADWHAGKAEDVLPVVINSVDDSEVMAVVDPPRGGLHPNVIRTLRRCQIVNRLIYVSCNPAGALQNIIDLTRTISKRVRGEPFTLRHAVTVDLFPHTSHCELVMLFERHINVLQER